MKYTWKWRAIIIVVYALYCPCWAKEDLYSSIKVFVLLYYACYKGNNLATIILYVLKFCVVWEKLIIQGWDCIVLYV